MPAISRLTSSTASGGRRLRISEACASLSERSRMADFRTPLRSAITFSGPRCYQRPPFQLTVQQAFDEIGGRIGIGLNHLLNLIDHPLRLDGFIIEFHAVKRGTVLAGAS